MITTLPEHLKPMVEKALEARLNRLFSIPLADLPLDVRQEMLDDLEDDCLAFLNACLDGGVAQRATREFGGASNDGSKPNCLILSLGEAK